ncbi:hypothetical protein R3W88_011507 [Solanum pinnatisectum]|uniref:RNase H type-1 domain-containing protein n=1 Tax=Solanum pinnatisectum TaxID=50273 RepID=A0AAV9L7G9_9SOLN|nr:hypothetical protein R3W88_011507 [Solanum pinnatisectum]
MDSKEKVKPLILWKVGKGDVSFWWDNWTNLGPLANLVQNQRTPKKTLKDFYRNNSWNIVKLKRILTHNVINSIVTIKFNNSKQDLSIWTPDSTGNFNSKSAWHIVRTNKGKTMSSSMTWHRKIPSQWRENCNTMERSRPMIHSQDVYWRKPRPTWVKLNVDGCNKGNLGSAAGYGGVIRDCSGNMIIAFAEFYGYCSNNVAARALWKDVYICKTAEGNSTANLLANLGEDSKCSSIFTEVTSLPSKVRASMKLELDGVPNFISRTKKNKFINDDCRQN